jgi:hypothetical protein
MFIILITFLRGFKMYIHLIVGLITMIIAGISFFCGYRSGIKDEKKHIEDRIQLDRAKGIINSLDTNTPIQSIMKTSDDKTTIKVLQHVKPISH